MCPRCGIPLKSWAELTEQDRERFLGLPGRNRQSREHRESNHLFCTRCTYEAHG